MLMAYSSDQQNKQCDVCDAFRDFAFVAGDKDSCVLKCHVFRCNAPAKAIATALHEMCSKVIHLIPNLVAVARLMPPLVLFVLICLFVFQNYEG